jgi:hypothetical protein
MPKKNNDKFPLRPLTNFHTISYSMFDGREGKSPIKRPAPSNFFSESIAPCDCGRPSSLGSAGDAPLTVRWQGRKMRIYVGNFLNSYHMALNSYLLSLDWSFTSSVYLRSNCCCDLLSISRCWYILTHMFGDV